jgi:hypothetical protein
VEDFPQNGFNRLEQYLESALEELKRLQSIRSKVENYILSQEKEVPRSFIVFASTDSGSQETLLGTCTYMNELLPGRNSSS